MSPASAEEVTAPLGSQHRSAVLRTARLSVKGDKDPGYGSTSKMISETAIALCEIDGPGGVNTPGTALGEALVKRLQANAGLTFAVEG